MKMHPREEIVRRAKLALMEALIEWDRNVELTDAEFIAVVTEEMSSMVLRTTKYAIRHERHGNTDTPGGLAADEDDDDPEDEL